MFQQHYFIKICFCQCSNNAWKCEQCFMKDVVEKLKKNQCCCIYLTMTFKYN